MTKLSFCSQSCFLASSSGHRPESEQWIPVALAGKKERRESFLRAIWFYHFASLPFVSFFVSAIFGGLGCIPEFTISSQIFPSCFLLYLHRLLFKILTSLSSRLFRQPIGKQNTSPLLVTRLGESCPPVFIFHPFCSGER